MGTNGFKVKVIHEWFIVVRSGCRQNLKFADFTLLLLGSLSKDDGYGNENVSPKYKLALSEVFRDYSRLGQLSQKITSVGKFEEKLVNTLFLMKIMC